MIQHADEAGTVYHILEVEAAIGLAFPLLPHIPIFDESFQTL